MTLKPEESKGIEKEMVNCCWESKSSWTMKKCSRKKIFLFIVSSEVNRVPGTHQYSRIGCWMYTCKHVALYSYRFVGDHQNIKYNLTVLIFLSLPTKFLISHGEGWCLLFPWGITFIFLWGNPPQITLVEVFKFYCFILLGVRYPMVFII